MGKGATPSWADIDCSFAIRPGVISAISSEEEDFGVNFADDEAKGKEDLFSGLKDGE